MKLGHVLQSTLRVNIQLDSFRSDELKRAARFWIGKEAGSYNVLTAEMYARGLAEMAPTDKVPGGYYGSYHEWRRNDLVRGLCEKLVLAGNSYDLYYSSSYSRSYPRSTLHPALVKAVAPAAPLSWNASSVCDEAVGAGRRSPAEVVLDLWRVAVALRVMGPGRPSRATRPPRRRAPGCEKRWVCAMPKKIRCRRPIRSRCSTNCCTAWA